MENGNYVRIPLDIGELHHRDFIIAQVLKETSEDIHVRTYDLFNWGDFFEIEHKYIVKKSDCIRAKACLGSEVSFCNELWTVIAIKDSSKEYTYLLSNGDRFIQASEQEIKINFNNLYVSVREQALNYEFHNPIFFISREKPNNIQQVINHSKPGFKEIVSSRVYLMQHQIDTIVRAIYMNPIRLIIADEVGLGKTIQTCVLIRNYLEKNKSAKILILAPSQLKHQWQNELKSKFWINASIGVFGERNQVYIESVDHIAEMYREIISMKFDLIVIDEVHNYITNKRYHSILCELSSSIENILLLSATPIQRRHEEYKKLLEILEPNRFQSCSLEEFSKLIQKQDFIRYHIYSMMRDLGEYREDDFIREEIEEHFDDVKGLLLDENINKLHNSYDTTNDLEEKELILRRVLSYISEFYQFERRIIRHRKNELNLGFACRKLELNNFNASTECEHRISEHLFDTIKKINNRKNSENDYNAILKLVSSFYSSPYAFVSKLENIKSIIPKDDFDKIHILAKNWEYEVEENLRDINKLFDDPDLINNKLALLIDYLDQEVDSQILIIIKHSETLDKILKIANEIFDKSEYAFYHSKMSDESKQEASNYFQANKKCRYLFADRSAGEGKNFQNADKIIHYDLTWDISEIEQEIGRLDRIGRKIEHDIISVVFCKVDSVEEDLFQIWDQIFHVYSRSLSGLEIVIKDVKDKIVESFIDSPELGIVSVKSELESFISEMTSYVEEERYYDMAKQVDPETEAEYDELIQSISGEHEVELKSSLLRWGNMVGFNTQKIQPGSEILTYSPKSLLSGQGSMLKVLPQLPDFRGILGYTNKSRMIEGTFNRDLAIKREDLVFFSPGEKIFDALFNSAMNHYKGRTAALRVYGDFEWTGFRICIKVDINFQKLYDSGISLKLFQNFKEIISKPLSVHYVNIEGEISEKEIEYLENEYIQSGKTISKAKMLHLGSRNASTAYRKYGYSDSDAFKRIYPRGDWENYLNSAIATALDAVKMDLSNHLKTSRIIEQLSFREYAIKNAMKYYNYNNCQDELDFIEKTKNVLREDVTSLEIDSISFIEVERW